MQKTTVTVTLSDRGTREVPGYAVGGGLVAHRSLDRGDRWVVTHAATGMHLGREWKTRRAAVAVAEQATIVLRVAEADGPLAGQIKGVPGRALWRVVRLDRPALQALTEAAEDLGKQDDTPSIPVQVLTAAGWDPTDDWGQGVCPCGTEWEPDGECPVCGPNPLRVAGLI